MTIPTASPSINVARSSFRPARRPDHSDRGPWSPTVLLRRAEADLTTIAAAMHSRGCRPREIEAALARQAALWRDYGAALPDGAALSAIQQLPGLARWTYLDGVAPEALVDGIELPGDAEHERRRRAYVLVNWLQRHAGTEAAERAVQAVERAIVASLEGRG